MVTENPERIKSSLPKEELLPIEGLEGPDGDLNVERAAEIVTQILSQQKEGYIKATDFIFLVGEWQGGQRRINVNFALYDLSPHVAVGEFGDKAAK